MPRDARGYLEDTVTACAHIEDLIQGRSLEDYLANDTLRWAVERQLIVVGEALYQLDRHFPETARRIPELRRIVNFRHVLVHGYANVHDEVVWGILETKLHPLYGAARALIRELG